MFNEQKNRYLTKKRLILFYLTRAINFCNLVAIQERENFSENTKKIYERLCKSNLNIRFSPVRAFRVYKRRRESKF